MDGIIISIIVALSVICLGIIIGVLKYVIISKRNKAKKLCSEDVSTFVANTKIKSYGRVAFSPSIVIQSATASVRKSSKQKKKALTDFSKNIPIEFSDYEVKPAYSQYSTKEKSVA